VLVKQENPIKRKQNLIKKRNLNKKKKNMRVFPVISPHIFGFSGNTEQLCIMSGQPSSFHVEPAEYPTKSLKRM
jgi:hypothetical protein